jgi:hypothetical protein
VHIHSLLWCTCALTYPFVCVIQLEDSRCMQCNITGMPSVGSGEPLFAENIWHTSVCTVAYKDGAVERSSASICICSKCCSLHTPWQHTWKYQISYNGYCNCFGIYSFFTYCEVLSKLTTSTELLFGFSNIILSNCQVHFCCSQNARISVHGIIFRIAWPVDRTVCRTTAALTSVPFFPSVSLM